MRLAALQEAQVGVEVGMRPDAVGEARAYPFTLKANLSGSDESELPIECTAEFVYVPPVRLHVQVEMGTLHGPLGDYVVVITNPTSLTLDVSLQGDDPNHALDFYFQGESDQLAVGREKAASVKGIVRLAEGAPTEGRTYPYVIRAHARNVDGPGELDEVREGVLVYEPPAPAEPAEEPNPLERVSLEVTPAQAQGDPARYTARLQNNGDTATLTILLARDAANALDYAFDPPQVYLEPGAGGQSSLSVRRKDDAPVGDGQAVPFEVVCGAPGSRPEHALVRQVEYLPAAQSRFEAILTPVEPSGLEGSYDVHLINHGGAAFPVVLRGRDTTGLLTFTFAPPRVSVPPDNEKVVRLTVKPNALEPLSEEHTYAFEVICWAPGTNAAHTLAGELRDISFRGATDALYDADHAPGAHLLPVADRSVGVHARSVRRDAHAEDESRGGRRCGQPRAGEFAAALHQGPQRHPRLLPGGRGGLRAGRILRAERAGPGPGRVADAGADEPVAGPGR